MKLFRQAHEQDNGLPVGYTEIEYLESTGTQWIDTEYIGNSDTKVEIKCYSENTTQNRALFGARDSNNYLNSFTIWQIGNNKIRFDYSADVSYTLRAIDWDPTVAHTIIKDGAKNYVDGVELASNNPVVFNCNFPFSLFGVNTGGSAQTGTLLVGRVYYCKVWDNDTLVRNFIPALDWNMTPCMYDLVSRKAFYNQGTDKFIAGRQIHSVEYLESTGTQYIDTGITGNNNTKIDVLFSKKNATASYINGIIGARGSNVNTNNLVIGINDAQIAIDFVNGSSGSYATYRYIVNNTLEDVKYRAIASKIERSLYQGDTLIGQNTTLSNQTINTTNLWMFGIQNYGFTESKIYYCKIYDNDVFVRDYIPAIDENGVGFMFDKVTHTIFDNAGSGSFTYGKEITKYKTRLGFVRFGKKPILPEGFTEVEYLESTGTQYIDTGITQNSNIKAELSVYPTVINKFIFGSRVNAASDGFGIFMHSNNDGSWYTFFNAANTMIPGFAVNEKYDIEFSKDGLIVNNQLLEGSYTSVFTGSLNIYLFAMNSNGAVDTRLFIGKIYSTKLYENDVLVRDYVPCLDASNVPCMYDKVEGKAYYSQSTDAFLYGEKKSTKYALAAPKVVIEVPPSEYKRLNYIESTGTQYIDTGITGTNENMGIDVNWAFSNNNANMCIFSSRSSQTSQTLTLFWLKTAANRLRFDSVGQPYFTDGVNTSVSNDIFNFNYKSADGAVATLTNKTVGQIQTLNIGKLKTFSSKPLYLFASKDTTDVYSWIKMYRCRIYDGNTTIRDFVPVLRRSDNKPGMYDTINKIFYVNAASGADFNYG